MGRTTGERRALGIILTAVVVSGCGAAVDTLQNHWDMGETWLRSEGSAKENHRDQMDLTARVSGFSGRGSDGTLGVPGLTFRWGMSYFNQNESISTALSLAMRSLLLQRMAVELGVMADAPVTRRNDSAVSGGSLSWIWFMGGGQSVRPYLVVGNGVRGGQRGPADTVLINFLGGIGFEFLVNRAFGIGLDCRAFAALSTEEPDNPAQGIICTTAFAFYPNIPFL